MQSTILIVDDELIVRRTLGDALSRANHHIETVASGAEALDRLQNGGIDLLLLDLQLGDMDGVTVMQRARSMWPTLSIVMLTAHGSLPSAISAVRSGAADYLLKPVKLDDLRERIASVLESQRACQTRNEQLRAMYEHMHFFLTKEGVIELGRPKSTSASEILHSGPLRLDIRQHTAIMHGTPITTTPSEFEILTELLRQPGVVASCGKLMRATNTMVSDEEEARQLIRPHIVRLRRKLEADPQQPRYLVSVRGVGYRWVGEGEM